MHRMVQVAAFVVALAGLALPAPADAAQGVSQNDVQRLQDTVNQISRDLAGVRQRDTARARELQDELDLLQDEVIYLKVKVRKERSVPRAEYSDLRDRLDDLRGRVRGEEGRSGGYGTPATGDAGPPARPESTRPGSIPSGTEFDVRLQTRLDSEEAKVEDRFEATTLADLTQDGKVLIPAGSTMRGVVTDVKSAGRLDRKASLSLSFDQITVRGRSYPIRATITQAIEGGGYKEDAEKIGTGAAVGGIIGGILGGFKGVLTGILIGGGGVVAATEGEDVELPPGTVLRVRLDAPLDVR